MAEHGELAQWVHRRARAALSVVGQATASARISPAFLIVGAQRCGTTTLYKTLAEHPDVLSAGLHKGVHYFDTGYRRGPRWYRGHFPTNLTARRRERATGIRPITGEASPYYMFHPLVPERIARDLPDVKLIVMLRDPVERAYSAFTHEKARGFETESFERAIELEETRLADADEEFAKNPFHESAAHQHNAYLSRGRYIDQLERLERHVGRDRIHVVDSDDLFTNVNPAFSETLDFLELRAWTPASLQKRNARPRRSLEGDFRRHLESYFEPFDERLESWWGRTPSWRAL